MIVENRVDVVVMVTNCEEKGRTKCHQYWPSSAEEDMEVGYPDSRGTMVAPMSISLESEQLFPDYVIRTLVVKSESDDPNTTITPHTVTQLHYVTWQVPAALAALARSL